jgi:hypothetical protein
VPLGTSISSRAMAQVVSRRPLIKGMTGFAFGPVHVGFVMYKVALGQVYISFLRFSLSILFHRNSPYSYIIWGKENRLVGDRSSETFSHHIDKNNNSITLAAEREGLPTL